MSGGYFVYAIIDRKTSLPAAPAGLDGAPLNICRWQELGAVVSFRTAVDHQPTVQDVLLHESVVEAVRRCGPALPVRFGTVLADTCDVQRALAERCDILRADLARLGDKLELGLIALWDDSDGPSPDDFASGDSLRSRLLAGGPGSQYLAARLADRRRIEQRQSRARRLADEIERTLKPWTLESKYALLPTPRLLLRGSYLVAPADIAGFREAFEAVRKQSAALRLLLSGPWPPYTFVTRANGGPGECEGLAPFFPSGL